MIDKTVGFALCGSFCTFTPVFRALEQITKQYATVIPVLSEVAAATDTRFGTAEEHIRKITELCGRRPLTTIREVEQFGPKKTLDLLIVAPCTGNTLGKLAAGITDTAVTMACKAHLRNGRPLILAISTNDGLSGSAESIARLLQRKNVYFIPFRQDAPFQKPFSLQSELSLLEDALAAALEGRQLQPILL